MDRCSSGLSERRDRGKERNLFRGWKTKRLTRRALTEASKLLTDKDVENAQELIDVGEWSLALELICDQLYEHEAFVPSDLFTIISEAGRFMGLDEKRWSELAVHPDERFYLLDHTDDSCGDFKLDGETRFHCCEGLTPQQAIEFAVEKGLGEVDIVRMLRSDYQLSFDTAVDMWRRGRSRGSE